jgi:hypothetical protein
VRLSESLVGAARGASPSQDPVAEIVAKAAEEWDIDAVIDPLMNADIEIAFPDREDEESFRELLRGSVTENLGVLRQHLGSKVDLKDVVLVRPVEFARTQAELGIPQASLQRSYRIGLQVLWKSWADCLAGSAAIREVEPAQAFEALRWSTQRILLWFDFVILTVDQGYAQREEILRQSGAKMRVAFVREILSGGLPATPEDLYYTLRYDLTAAHLVIQLADMSDAASQGLASRLGKLAQASSTLVVRMSVTEVIVWLGRPRSWQRQHVDSVLNELRQTGHRAAVSEAASGIEGFRAGYVDVTRVEAVRAFWLEAPPVLPYADVRLEALLIANTSQARRFVAQELGLLAEDTQAAARLRETLLASLAAGSHIATAELLQLHEHTVRNRIRRAEEVLGYRLSERRVELQVALRLHRLIGSGSVSA